MPNISNGGFYDDRDVEALHAELVELKRRVTNLEEQLRPKHHHNYEIISSMWTEDGENYYAVLGCLTCGEELKIPAPGPAALKQEWLRHYIDDYTISYIQTKAAKQCIYLGCTKSVTDPGASLCEHHLKYGVT